MDKNIRDILERPFEASQIKQRQGSFGRTLDYISGGDIISRLLEGLQGDFSFSIIDWKVMEDEIVVLGQLDACGLSKSAFGNKKIARNTKDNSIISIGDDIKAAATDSLKVCAKLFGVALHLYTDKESVKEEPKQEYRSGTNGGNGSNGSNGYKATNAQLRAIVNLQKRHNIGSKDMTAILKDVAGIDKIDLLDKSTSSLVIKYLSSYQAAAA